MFPITSVRRHQGRSGLVKTTTKKRSCQSFIVLRLAGFTKKNIGAIDRGTMLSLFPAIHSGMKPGLITEIGI